MLQTVGCVAS